MTVTKVGAELIVNTTTAGRQYISDITGLANGRFVITWDDDSNPSDPNYGEVKARIYQDSAQVLSGEFIVNQNIYDDQSSGKIAALPNGGFAVAFNDGSDAYVGGTYITVRSFTASGVPTTGDLRVSGGSGDYYASAQSAVALSNNELLILRSAEDAAAGVTAQIPSGQSSQIFRDGNNESPPIGLTAVYGFRQDLALLANNRFVYVFKGSDTEYVGNDYQDVATGAIAQIRSLDGTAVGAAFQLSEGEYASVGAPAVTTLADGRFVATWSERPNGSNGPYSVKAHIYSADGVSLGESFTVNTTSDYVGDPDVAALSSGGFAITWSDFGPSSGSSQSSIKARVFGITGEPMGGEETVSASGGLSTDARVATLANDKFVIGWDHTAAPTPPYNEYDIYARELQAVVNAPIVGNSADNTLQGLEGGAVLRGLGGNDILVGGTGADLLDGGTGADRMEGKLGNDTYIVDNAGDTIVEVFQGNTDTVMTTLSSYTLQKNLENLIYTGSGAFTGSGNTSDNELRGGAGDDTLDGLSGADIMAGSKGNDVYFVDNAGDKIEELRLEGTDTVYSKVSFTLAANVERLVLSTTSSINGTGNGLDNVITGNAGLNVLDGRAGSDTLTGGANNDTFVFRGGEANGDKITDFQGVGAAKGDTIKLVGYGNATVTHDSSHPDYYIITPDNDHLYTAPETIQVVGVTNLDTVIGSGHNDFIIG